MKFVKCSGNKFTIIIKGPFIISTGGGGGLQNMGLGHDFFDELKGGHRFCSFIFKSSLSVLKDGCAHFNMHIFHF